MLPIAVIGGGSWRTALAKHLTQKLAIEAPIMEQVAAIFHENKPAQEAIRGVITKQIIHNA